MAETPHETRPRLLVVDDDQAILRLVARLAEQVGYEVDTCAGGREAIERLAARRVDLVFVDLWMPDVGGLDVVRAVRDRDPRCNVVLMTGKSSIVSAVEAVKAGATDYLTKPFDVGRVRGLLSDVRDEILGRDQLMHAEGELARQCSLCGMIGRDPGDATALRVHSPLCATRAGRVDHG